MTGRRRRIAVALLRAAAVVLPPARKPWAIAMLAELDAIADDRHALGFAFGCLWASLRQRAVASAAMARAVRVATPTGLLTLALVAALLTVRHAGSAAPVAGVFGLSAAIFAGAALLFLCKGAAALGRAAAVLVALYALASLGMWWPGVVAGVVEGGGEAAGGGATRLYRALAVEGVVLWAAVCLGAAYLVRAGTAAPTGQG